MAPKETRPVDREDLDGIAMALPEVTREGTDAHPVYAVRGTPFLHWREPCEDALDPETGEPAPDVIAVVVPGREGQEAILRSGPPWFTTACVDGHDHVLVRERDLGRLDYLELAEIVTDAWATQAPAKLVRQHLG